MASKSSPHSLNAGIEGILFDMDGVLIDSEPLHEFTLLELSEKFGRRFESQADLEVFKGRTELTAAQNLLERFPHLTLTPTEIVHLRLEQVQQNFHLVTMIEGVRVFLSRSKAAGYRMGLTTSADPSIQQLAFSTFQLSEFFDAVVTGSDVQASKPDPEPYLLTAAKLGVSPGRCLVIEDALSGVRSGKSAGCRVAALTTSFPRETLLEAGADFVATSFEMLSASFFGTSPVDGDRGW